MQSEPSAQLSVAVVAILIVLIGGVFIYMLIVTSGIIAKLMVIGWGLGWWLSGCILIAGLLYLKGDVDKEKIKRKDNILFIAGVGILGLVLLAPWLYVCLTELPSWLVYKIKRTKRSV